MRFRLSLAFLFALLGALSLSAAPAAAVETGVNETMNQTIPLDRVAGDLRADWVRIWGTWEAAEPSPGRYDENYLTYLRTKVDRARARGVKVLMIIGRTPAWANGGRGAIAPPTDPARFGAFMGEIAKRLPGVDAWEIWNEEDETTFWLDGPQPARYAALLKAAYPAVKRAQPRDVVVTGGTVGNNFDFIESIYKHGAQGSFDAVGVHTDTACLVDGPDMNYRDEQGRIGRYVFTGHREVHAVMARHGDGAKPIWMTELGWSTQSTAPRSCPVGKWARQKPLGVTAAQQADFLTQAYRCLQADPFVQVALWFGAQDFTGSAHAGGYGLYRLDGSAKPAAAAFRALDRGIAAKPCGAVIDNTGPQIVVSKPTDGAVFKRSIGIDATAVDSGGAGIRGMEVHSDGKLFRYFGDGRAVMPEFWPSREWKPGKHTITFKGIDEAGNTASVTVTVKKVRRMPKVKTATQVAVETLDPSTVRVTGRVTSPTAHAAAKVRGKMLLKFQRSAGGAKPQWKTVEQIRRRASAALDVTRTLAPGHWRVFLQYHGRKGFRKSRSQPVVFDVAPAAPVVPAAPAA